jgi:hypothetical protein
LIQQTGVSLSASSEESGLPVTHLLDQARGRRWRSKTGWNIKRGFNDLIDFWCDDGLFLAHLAEGNYSTGALMAAQVQTAMEQSGYNVRQQLSSNLKGWWRADSSTVDADGLVSQATDLMTGNRHLVQATAGNRPLWVADAVDGRPGWYWDGTNASMRLVSTGFTMTDFLGTNGIGTVVIVFRLDSDASATDTLLWAGSGSEFMIFSWSGTADFAARIHDTAARTATKTAAAGGVSQWHHGWLTYDQTNVSAYVDNANTAAAASTAATGAQHANVMGSVFNLGALGGSALKGYILECMVFNSALSETNRRHITAYWRQRYPSLAVNDTTTAVAKTDAITVSYSGTTKKFTLANAGTTFQVLATGFEAADIAALAMLDLGFTLANKTGAGTYTAENAAYQSRHYLEADLGAAAAATAGVALDHNAGSGGTLTIQGNDEDLWVAPDTSEALAGDTEKRLDYWTSSSKRFWRLVIDDVQNDDGYAELGVWSLGVYVTPSVCFSDAFGKVPEELSGLGYGLHGAHHQDERPQRWVWSLPWSQVPEADRTLFELLITTIKAGGNFFIGWDPSGTPADMHYVFRRDATGIQMATAFPYWDIALQLAEALE